MRLNTLLNLRLVAIENLLFSPYGNVLIFFSLCPDLGVHSTSFLDTDLRKITFREVIWYRKSIFRKKILYDELTCNTLDEFKIIYEKIYDNYHQLVSYYQEKREFETAEDFHVGEMEMRRKKVWADASPKWTKIRKWANSFFFYKILSNYGTSYWHALGVLIIMFFLFSGFFLITGFKTSPENISSPVETIDYNWCIYPKNHEISYSKWFCTWAADYKKGISFALSSLPVLKSRNYEVLGLGTQILAALEVIILSSQFALLLLAVRRRFKR